MVSEAQKRASAKYNKEKMKQRAVTFSPNGMELFNYLETKQNKSAYIKALIQADMEGRVSW